MSRGHRTSEEIPTTDNRENNYYDKYSFPKKKIKATMEQYKSPKIKKQSY